LKSGCFIFNVKISPEIAIQYDLNEFLCEIETTSGRVESLIDPALRTLEPWRLAGLETINQVIRLTL